MHKAIDTKNTEFRAEARFQRCSPQKAKLVLDLIKGLRVEKGIHQQAHCAGGGEGAALGGPECSAFVG